jgi:F-type H+-transporting ATPase subunit b
LEDQFAAAERRLAEAQALLQQYQQKLEQAAVEAQQILSQARAEAERQAAAILARAHEEAEAEHRRHLIEIQQAAEEAKRLLVQHAAKMAVTIAERVLEAHMDPLTHRKLLNTALSQLVAWEQGDKEFSGTSERGLSPEN